MKYIPVFAYSVPTASIHPKQTLLLFNFFLVPEPDISLDFFFFKYLSTLSPSNKVKSYSAAGSSRRGIVASNPISPSRSLYKSVFLWSLIYSPKDQTLPQSLHFALHLPLQRALLTRLHANVNSFLAIL